MSVLLGYKFVWAGFFERVQGASSAESGPCSMKMNTHDVTQNIFSTRTMQNSSVQFCAEFFPHSACQCLVHIQHWDV